MERASERGVNDVIAYVLLTGIIITSSIVILQTGTQAVTETRQKTGAGQAQDALAQLDAQIDIVARGAGVSTQTVRLNLMGGSDESLHFRESGRMRIQTTNYSSGTSTEHYNESLGTIVYESSAQTIVYQSGAVFQESTGADDSQTMTLNQPPAYFSGDALLLPIVRLDTSPGEVTDDSFTVSGNPITEAGVPNPVYDKKVTVFITSEYYKEWGDYFATQTEGETSQTYYSNNNTVAVTIGETHAVVPEYNGTFVSQSDIVVNSDNCDEPTSCVAADVTGPINVSDDFHGQTGDSENITEGADVTSESINDYVYDRVDFARDSGDTSVGDTSDNVITQSKTLDSGTYYVKGIDYTGSSNTLTLDASGGDVTLVVDGDILLGNSGQLDAVSQENAHVKIITTGDVQLTGGGFTAQKPVATEIYGSSETDAVIDSAFQSGLYIPTENPATGGLADHNTGDFCEGGSYDVCVNSNADIDGSIVAGSFRVHENAAASYVEPAASGHEIAQVGPHSIYLQVSDNVVTIRDN